MISFNVDTRMHNHDPQDMDSRIAQACGNCYNLTCSNFQHFQSAHLRLSVGYGLRLRIAQAFWNLKNLTCPDFQHFKSAHLHLALAWPQEAVILILIPLQKLCAMR